MNAQTILDQLEVIYKQYAGAKKLPNDQHTIKGEGYQYNVVACKLPSMIKKYKALAKSERGRAKKPPCRATQHRPVALQEMYAKCRTMSDKELVRWHGQLKGKKSSFGNSDFPYLSNGDILRLIEETLNVSAKPLSNEAKAKIEIIYYSEKAIALFGDTKPYREDLKAMGCRFNPFLLHNGVKTKGWIASKKREKEIRTFVEHI